MNALVLSGGGARGAFEAGVVTALNEHERFDLVFAKLRALGDRRYYDEIGLE